MLFWWPSCDMVPGRTECSCRIRAWNEAEQARRTGEGLKIHRCPSEHTDFILSWTEGSFIGSQGSGWRKGFARTEWEFWGSWVRHLEQGSLFVARFTTIFQTPSVTPSSSTEYNKRRSFPCPFGYSRDHVDLITCVHFMYFFAGKSKSAFRNGWQSLLSYCNEGSVRRGKWPYLMAWSRRGYM